MTTARPTQATPTRILDKLARLVPENTCLKPIRPHTIVSDAGSIVRLDQNNQPHNTRGAAIVTIDDKRIFCIHGELKRADQKATIIEADGTRKWAVGSWRDADPKLEGPVLDIGTRGPAIVYPSGRVIYVDYDGEFMMEEMWSPEEARRYFPESRFRFPWTGNHDE